MDTTIAVVAESRESHWGSSPMYKKKLQNEATCMCPPHFHCPPHFILSLLRFVHSQLQTERGIQNPSLLPRRIQPTSLVDGPFPRLPEGLCLPRTCLSCFLHSMWSLRSSSSSYQHGGCITNALAGPKPLPILGRIASYGCRWVCALCLPSSAYYSWCFPDFNPTRRP